MPYKKFMVDAESHRPVQKEYLELTTNAQDLLDEVEIRADSASKLAKWVYARLLPWKVRLGRYWMNKGKQALDADWGKYKDTLVKNTGLSKI